MSDTSHTATVQALTAEVRVLMVGSRQVTLSVFAQLDECPFEEVEAFGRVRARDHDGLWVVGRRLVDGSLVKSQPGAHAVWPLSSGQYDAVDHWWAHVGYQERARMKTVSGKYSLGNGILYDGGMRRCVSDAHSADDLWPSADRALSEIGIWLTAKRYAYKEAGELPLIILAGLR